MSNYGATEEFQVNIKLVFEKASQRIELSESQVSMLVLLRYYNPSFELKSV